MTRLAEAFRRKKSSTRKSILVALLFVSGLVAGWVINNGSRQPAVEFSTAAVVQRETVVSLTVPTPAAPPVLAPTTASSPTQVVLPPIEAANVVAKPSEWPDNIEWRINNFFTELHDATVQVQAVHCIGPECQVTLTTEDSPTARPRLQQIMGLLLRSPSIGAGSMGTKGAESAAPGLLQQDFTLFSPSVKFKM